MKILNGLDQIEPVLDKPIIRDMKKFKRLIISLTAMGSPPCRQAARTLAASERERVEKYPKI
jgi:hypothetical protein